MPGKSSSIAWKLSSHPKKIVILSEPEPERSGGEGESKDPDAVHTIDADPRHFNNKLGVPHVSCFSRRG